MLPEINPFLNKWAIHWQSLTAVFLPGTYEYTFRIDITEEGGLVNHIVLGYQLVEDKIKRNKEFRQLQKREEEKGKGKEGIWSDFSCDWTGSSIWVKIRLILKMSPTNLPRY